MTTDSSVFSSVIFISINFMVYIFFIVMVFQGKMRYRPLVSGLLILGYCLLSTVAIILWMLPNSPFLQDRYLVLVLWFCCTIAIAAVVLRSNLLQLLFLFFAILDIQFNMMKLSEIIFKLDFFPRVFGSEDIQLLLINSVVLALSLPLLWYLLVVLFKKVISRDIDRSYWKYLFVIPISVYLYCIFSSINNSVQQGTDLGITLFIQILLNLFSYLSYIAVLQMLLKTHDSLLATEKASIAEKQLLIQTEQYKQLSDNMERTERLQHDMRHHFVTIKGFIERKDFEGANSYLEDCTGRELPQEEISICEKHSVDMILRYYTALARKTDIQVSLSVQLPDSFQMADTDLCVIFGNLVENAVESCDRQLVGKKFISIKSKMINENMLAVTVSNSYQGNIIRNGDQFFSQKHAGVGIGTSSVKSIVERCGGEYKFSFDHQIFKVSVLLMS